MIGIAACDPNGVMGENGKLPWHCPEELQHFADTTRGHPMIMGYRTFLTLPAHYFTDRKTIIFTHNKPVQHNPHQHFVSSLEEFLALKLPTEKLYVIGGAQIYTLFLEANLISEFILTKMTHTYNGDTFFPLSLLKGWEEQTIRKTPLFTIYRYFNPQKVRHASKSP